MPTKPCKMSLTNISGCVKVDKDLFFDFFNFVMESVLLMAVVLYSGRIFSKGVQLLTSADDIDIIGYTMWNITAAFSASTCGILAHIFRSTTIPSTLQTRLFTLVSLLPTKIMSHWKIMSTAD